MTSGSPDRLEDDWDGRGPLRVDYRDADTFVVELGPEQRGREPQCALDIADFRPDQLDDLIGDLGELRLELGPIVGRLVVPSMAMGVEEIVDQPIRHLLAGPGEDIPDSRPAHDDDLVQIAVGRRDADDPDARLLLRLDGYEWVRSFQ